jgi:hypothetical protein
MTRPVLWTWKMHANGERRGGMKAHAFEDSTRRSLCYKYDDGPEWNLAPCGAGGLALPLRDCCSSCLRAAGTALSGIPSRLSQRTEET